MWGTIAIVSSLVAVFMFLKRVYFSSKPCLLNKRLDGQLAIVTGCNTGIGLATVGELARRGARVIMACRNALACDQARIHLLTSYGPQQQAEVGGNSSSHLTPITEDLLVCESLDLACPESIRAFAKRITDQYSRVDLLVNNAAINLPKAKVDPVDGIEEHIRVNHLGHFLLTNLLIDGVVRVVNVSSMMHRFAELNVDTLAYPFPVGSPYSNSKLANVMHARQLSNRLFESEGLLAVSLHPGLVRTDIFRHSEFRRWAVHNLLAWLSKSPLEGAQTILFCCLADDLQPGGYYDNCRLARMNPQALDDSACCKAWETSERLVGIWESKKEESGVEKPVLEETN